MNSPSFRTPDRAHVPRGIVAGFGILTLALLIAGCAQAEAPGSSAAPSPSVSAAEGETRASDDASPCDLLDHGTLTSLLGAAPDGTEVTVPGSNIPACQFGDLTTNGVQVAQVPADEWAQSLPAMVEAVRAAAPEMIGDQKFDAFVQASERIESGGTITGDEACDFFSVLLEIQGQAPGSSLTVNYLPDQANAIALTAQQCVDGTFTSVVLGDSGGVSDPALPDQLAQLVADIGAAA